MPDAPTGLDATPDNGAADLTFTPGGGNGREITGYQVRVDESAWTDLDTEPGGGGTLTGRVTGLTNGQSYALRVLAVNVIGNGAASSAENVTPQPVAPDPPTGLVAAPGNGRAVLTFAPPADDGGSEITGYRASVGGGAYADLDTDPAAGGQLTGAVGNLTNGQTYAIRVVAANAAGASAPAGPEDVTPEPEAPLAPTGLTPTRGDRRVTVTFNPADDGGDAIIRYEVSINAAQWATLPTESAAGGKLRAMVADLTPGQLYKIRLRAVNGVGAGAASDTLQVTAVGVPDAPGDVAVDPGNRRLTISFDPAEPNGGTISRYEVTLNGGGSWATLTTSVDGTRRVGVVTALVNGQTYQVAVRALNQYGNGDHSVVVTDQPQPGPPGAPGPVAVSPRDGSLVVSFLPPEDDGGSPITGYEVSVDKHAWTALATSGGIGGGRVGTVPGLTNGVEYDLRVRAVSSAGAGDQGDEVSGTPLAPPAAPTLVTAAAGDASIVVSWTPPAGSNAAVTGYVATASPGPATCETTGDSCVLGAVAGTTYTVTVVARSLSGDSPAGGPSNAVTPALPDLPPDTPFELTTTEGDISTAEPGQEITFVGDGFAAHSTVAIAVYSQARIIARPVTNAKGAFRTTVTVPTNLAAGTHTMVAQGVGPDGLPRSMTLEIEIGGGLPMTGDSLWSRLRAGLLLVLAGAALLVISGRRGSARATAGAARTAG